MLNHQISKIISGGQTGADRAALDIAIKFNIPHGGYCPKGRKAEDGVIDGKYQLIETESAEYETRTEMNVIHSDGTLVLCRDTPMGGTLFTIEMAKKHEKPYFLACVNSESIDDIISWIKTNNIKELNIAGPRASQTEEIYDSVSKIIEQVILHLINMNKKDLLSFTIEYNNAYDNAELRGQDVDERPWDLTKVILNYAGADKNLLDVGCGTGFKLKPLAPHFDEIIGVDCSDSMLLAAEEQISAAKINNIFIKKENAYQLSFADETFDVVTCMLSRWTLSELHRVLKKNGILIIEHLGCQDKYSLKKYFDDQNSSEKRGQYLEYNNQQQLINIEEEFYKYFNIVEIKNGFWKTAYTHDGIRELLKYTPTIKNYNEVSDYEKLACALKELTEYSSERKVILEQNRILIIATGKITNV